MSAVSFRQYLFLNGRWVRDRGLFQSVQDAYRGLLMTSRYPIAFLFLELPPDQVDVNVHPTKAEVRFRDKESVYQLIQQAVSARLQAADLTARLQLKTRKEYVPVSEAELRSSSSADSSVSNSPAGEKEVPPARPKEMPAAARSTAPSPDPRILLRPAKRRWCWNSAMLSPSWGWKSKDSAAHWC